MVNDFLICKGFERMEVDPCIYKKTERVKVDGKHQIKHSIVALYVDDLLVACSITKLCKDLESFFQSEFQMKIMGEVRYILGMEVNNDLKNHEIHKSQCKYIKQLLNDYNKYNNKVYDSPMDNRTPFSKSQCPVTDSKEARLMRNMPYRELIPDISFAVGSLAKYTSNPGRVHWKALLKILGYLSQTLNHFIRYKRDTSNEDGMPVRGYARGILPQLSDFQCYVDASFAGDVDTRRSTTGYIFKICGGPVPWQSRMQPSVALSSMESEYMVASAATQEAMWMNRIGFKTSKPITLCEDNKAAILFANHPGDHRRSKHIDTRRYFVGKDVTNGEIELVYVNTEDQQADGMTKA
jgi:Reverse transcriptase (RNA-dependent DNA polymerase)